MNRLGILAYSTAVAGIAVLTAREAIEPSAYLYGRHSSNVVALGVIGWFISTLAPLALSMVAWFLSSRKKPKWLWHVLFIPSAIALYNVGASLLFFAAGVPDGDSIEGYTLIMAFGLLCLTLLVHGTAALWFAVAGHRASVR